MKFESKFNIGSKVFVIPNELSIREWVIKEVHASTTTNAWIKVEYVLDVKFEVDLVKTETKIVIISEDYTFSSIGLTKDKLLLIEEYWNKYNRLNSDSIRNYDFGLTSTCWTGLRGY